MTKNPTFTAKYYYIIADILVMEYRLIENAVMLTREEKNEKQGTVKSLNEQFITTFKNDNPKFNESLYRVYTKTIV
jgi:hypothetical protein